MFVYSVTMKLAAAYLAAVSKLNYKIMQKNWCRCFV